MQVVKSCVPQGSVLGQALFLISIYDMSLSIHESYAEIYADDTTVHVANKYEKEVEIELQSSATEFKSWCLQHKMFVHLAKFSLMNIGTWQNGKESVSIFILLLVYFHMSLQEPPEVNTIPSYENLDTISISVPSYENLKPFGNLPPFLKITTFVLVVFTLSFHF